MAALFDVPYVRSTFSIQLINNFIYKNNRSENQIKELISSIFSTTLPKSNQQILSRRIEDSLGGQKYL